METNGGGWTTFLIRKNQTVQENFRRKWQNYKDGFGTAPNEYWMGTYTVYIVLYYISFPFPLDITIIK